MKDAADASRRTGTARDALVEAAKRLLPDRAPSTIAGRDLAAEADVNYGLVHHYFGGKDAALTAGLRALRTDFIAAHGDAANMPLLTESDPYLKALVRSNIDSPESVSFGGDFPISARLVDALTERLTPTRGDRARVDAQARSIAMVSIQLCVAVFGPVLLDATGVGPDERDDVRAALAALYDEIALIAPDGSITHDTPDTETT